MELVEYQEVIEAYVSDAGFLCIKGNDTEFGREVMLMVSPSNIEMFMLGLETVIKASKEPW